MSSTFLYESGDWMPTLLNSTSTATECLNRFRDYAAALGNAAHVRMYQESARPEFVKLGLDGPPGFLVHVRDHDACALFRELDRGGPPDSESAARDDHHLAVELTHS